MTNLNASIFSLAALAFSAVAHAAPVQYQITTSSYAEYGTGDSASDPSLYANGTSFTARFYYDAATLAASANNPSANGPYSYYSAAINNLTGNIAGNTFSASNADVRVNDTTSSEDSVTGDALTIMAGSTGFDTIPNSNFIGFTINNFSLIGMGLQFAGSDGMLPSQSLPSTLNQLNTSSTVAALYFKNSTGDLRIVAFSNVNIMAVPIPSSALCFLSGLIGLGANAARKLKR